MNTLFLLLLSWVIIPTKVITTQVIPAPTPDPEVQAQVLAANSDSLLVEVNRVRELNGCKKPLTVNLDLAKAAQERAEYIAADHWYHEGYIETVEKYYRYQHLGENLARYYKTDKAIVQAWLDSPKHKDNLLNCEYVETGIGRSGAYVAQEYGKR